MNDCPILGALVRSKKRTIDVLRTMIISPVSEQVESLQKAMSELARFATVCRTMDAYPEAVTDVIRALRAHAPQVVFLSLEDIEKAQHTARILENEVAGIQIVAIHTHCDAAILRETMRAGLREFLADPFELPALREVLGNVKALLEKNPPAHTATDQIFSFLPSKAGVGTTTLAVNLSAALSRIEKTKVILTDFDLNSGMLRFLLKLKNEHSVMEALENSPNLDESMWSSLVTSIGQLDVMHAGKVNPNLRISKEHLVTVLQFWRRNYDVACVDLSGNLERYSQELIRESKRVLVVCTAETPSLHLTREKIAFLKSLDLDARISVILNRVPKSPVLSEKQVEDVLGVPVLRAFSNDYTAVSQATASGEFVDPMSKLGRQYTEFAYELLERTPQPSADRKRKLLDMFSVSSVVGAAHAQK
jgi:pilus assembly protein CpaE